MRKYLFLFLAILMMSFSCSRKTPLEIELFRIMEHKESFDYTFNIEGVDSMMVYAEYPDLIDFGTFLPQYVDLFSQNYKKELYESFELDGVYSLYVIFSKEQIQFQEIKMKGKYSVYFRSACGFTKVYPNDKFKGKVNKLSSSNSSYWLSHIDSTRYDRYCIKYK